MFLHPFVIATMGPALVAVAVAAWFYWQDHHPARPHR